MINLKDFCYHIHHINNNNIKRDFLFNRMNNILFSHMDQIESETILINSKEDFNIFKDNNNFNVVSNLKYGEIGLWASNYKLFKKFLESNYKYLIIFEDDIYLHDNFLELIKLYFPLLPKGWGCFSLFQPEISWENIPFENYKLKNIEWSKDFIWKSYQTWSTGGLLLNRSSVFDIVNYIEAHGIDLPIDLFLFKEINEVPIPGGGNKIFECYSISRMAQHMSSLMHLNSTIQDTELLTGLN
jgi:hypothetical protein